MLSLQPDLESDIQRDVLHEPSELNVLCLCGLALLLACSSEKMNISD